MQSSNQLQWSDCSNSGVFGHVALHFETLIHFFLSFRINPSFSSLRCRLKNPLGEIPIARFKSRCHSAVVIPPLSKGARMSSSEYFSCGALAFLRSFALRLASRTISG